MDTLQDRLIHDPSIIQLGDIIQIPRGRPGEVVTIKITGEAGLEYVRRTTTPLYWPVEPEFVNALRDLIAQEEWYPAGSLHAATVTRTPMEFGRWYNITSTMPEGIVGLSGSYEITPSDDAP